MNDIKRPAEIYSVGNITWAALLGGPLASGYLLGQNFSIFGQKDRARVSFWLGALLTIGLLGISFAATRNAMRSTQLLLALATFLLARGLQRDKINSFLGSGFTTAKGIKVTLIGLASLGLTLAAVVIFATLIEKLQGVPS